MSSDGLSRAARGPEVAAKLARVRGWLEDSGGNPTVRGAKSEDTFVVSRSGAAVPVTNSADWPLTATGRPAILPV
jgi:hypothetical protein